MVVVVTGQRGFLGGYLTRELARRSFTVRGLGRPEVEIPSRSFREALGAIRPDVVVHAAGPASVAASVADPDADRAGSVDVLAELLACIGDVRLVLISSAAVYGDPEQLPIAEDAAVRPISPYGVHRAECERLVRDTHQQAAILRVFSAYGEGLRRQVMWDICRKALVGGPIALAGEGVESRDFVHARDVAAAAALVVEAAPFDGEAYNVGTGQETSIRSLADLLVAALGTENEIRFTHTPRLGDPIRWRADIGCLSALGFVPRIEIRSGTAAYATWARRVLT